MHNISTLLERLLELEKMAKASRWRRWQQQPFRYTEAMVWVKFIYPTRLQAKLRKAYCFFDTPIHLLLPAGLDIYLLGGKTHNSEIRLARYLVQHLKVEETFIDVGAHFGYFTLLAAHLVGKKGIAVAFEAASETFDILKKNTIAFSNIHIHHQLIGDEEQTVPFYEFPILYSEYNSAIKTDTKWQKQGKKVDMKMLRLADYLTASKLKPSHIKIDVEGAEDKVIIGLVPYLKTNNCTLIIEATQLHLATHLKMERHLKALDYLPFRITNEGKLQQLNGLIDVLQNKLIDSDNFVFQKV